MREKKNRIKARKYGKLCEGIDIHAGYSFMRRKKDGNKKRERKREE